MITKGKPKLADIDGTVPGKVMLMSIKLVDPMYDNPDPKFEDITEGDHDEDPWTFALALKEGIEDDWPGREWAIVGNWRARYLRWARTMPSFLPGPHTPEAYLTTFEGR